MNLFLTTAVKSFIQISSDFFLCFSHFLYVTLCSNTFHLKGAAPEHQVFETYHYSDSPINVTLKHIFVCFFQPLLLTCFPFSHVCHLFYSSPYSFVMLLCHIFGGGGTEEEGVRMPAGSWKVSDLDIIVDPLVLSSEPRKGPEAPTDADCTSSEFFGHDIKNTFLIRMHKTQCKLFAI